MKVANKTVLITGANRGIGQALVNEALRRGAKRVYAGTRSGLKQVDERVKPLTLDVTNVSQIQKAAEEVGTLDVLVNNAGVVDQDIEVFDGAGRARYLRGVGDVEHERRHALVRMLERSPRGRINLLCPAS